MEPWQLYSLLAAQLITGIIALILAFLIYKRNPSYKGNIFLSIGFIFYSLYPFGSFFYELGINELVVQISIRASYFGTILGSGSFLISMTIFCLSSISGQLKKYEIVGGILTILVCITIFLPNSITSVELNPSSCERSILLMGAISTYILLTTGRMIYLLTITVNQFEDKNSQVSIKLKKFRLALIISLGIMIFSIIENVTQLHFFNIVTYLILFLTYIVISQPLLKKQTS